MRPDMPKIAVERPRYNHRDGYPRGCLSSQYGHDLEAHPRLEAMSWHRYGTKGFSDNLAPLYRFLRTNVGRPWNKVWSEMCAHIRFDNTVQKHILGHVFGVVEPHVQLHGGDPYALSHSWRYPRNGPLRGRGRWPTLYVCPTSGLLKEAKHESRKKRPNAAPTDVVTVSGDERLRRIIGVWYREHLARDESGTIVVTCKRQLATRELAKLGLKENAA